MGFCLPKAVYAETEEIGGKLLDPVMSLFVSLGDGAMTLLQKIIFNVDETLINIDISISLKQQVICKLLTALTYYFYYFCTPFIYMVEWRRKVKR